MKEGVFVLQRFRQEKIFTAPNVLTLIRIGLLPIVVILFRLGDMTGALCIYLISMLTDVLDGTIARGTHQITALGKLLDPIADKISSLSILILLAQTGQISSWFLSVVCIKELFLILGSYLVLRRGVIVQSLPIGKGTTAVFVAAISAEFLKLDHIANALLYMYLVLSLGGLLWYARSTMLLMLETESEATGA